MDGSRDSDPRKYSGAIIGAAVLIVVQYILAFFVYNLPGWRPLQWIGWGIWVLSLVFGIAPIYLLRRHGRVAHGESYVHTTRLVETGLYAVVRHPQYLAGILFNLALMLLAQHWLVALTGGLSMALMYVEIRDADREGLEKFGDEYRQYMQRVPRANFLLGLARLARKKVNLNI